MSVEIRTASPDDREHWDRYVERSPQTSPFHRIEVLQLLAEYSGTELSLLVGRKGEEPVGIFPVFALHKGPITAAMSPPPKLNIPYLGPAMLNLDGLKQRKVERRRRSFIEGCIEWIREELRPHYQKFVLDPAHNDCRQFHWNDCSLVPRHTYVVSLEDDVESQLARFSSDARRNVREQPSIDCEITEGDSDAAARIIEQVRRRYEEQDRPYSLSPEFASRLYEAFPEGEIRPYVCRVEGSFVGGIIAPSHGETIYRWQGGVTPDGSVDVAVNDHLDWAIMRDAIDRKQTQYDLVGADAPRINGYKAKFNPTVETFYQVESGSWPITQLVDLYRRWV